MKVGTGSTVFYRFHRLDAVVGRSALHVTALRGSGHRLAPIAPRSWLVDAGHDTWHICRPWSSKSGTSTCCRLSVRRLHPWVSLLWPPPAFWTERSSSGQRCWCPRVSLRAVLEWFGNAQTCRVPLDWRSARRAAADQTPEPLPQQQRSHERDARKNKGSSLGKVTCPLRATLCVASFLYFEVKYYCAFIKVCWRCQPPAEPVSNIKPLSCRCSENSQQAKPIKPPSSV